MDEGQYLVVSVPLQRRLSSEKQSLARTCQQPTDEVRVVECNITRQVAFRSGHTWIECDLAQRSAEQTAIEAVELQHPQIKIRVEALLQVRDG